MKFAASTAAALVVLASSALASTVAELKVDIQAIDSSVTSLNQHLQVDSLNYFNGIAIHQASQAVAAKIKAASTCVKELTEKPTEADAKFVLEALAKTEVKVKAVTTRLITIKSQWEGLGVLGLAQGNVKSFKFETAGLCEELVNVSPAATKSAAENLAAKFNADLDSCAAAYGIEISGVFSGSVSGGFGGAAGAGVGGGAKGAAGGKGSGAVDGGASGGSKADGTASAGAAGGAGAGAGLGAGAGDTGAIGGGVESETGAAVGNGLSGGASAGYSGSASGGVSGGAIGGAGDSVKVHKRRL